MTVGINYLTSDNKYLRVYLKNHNNAYSIQDDMTSLKVNGAQVKINDSSDLLLDLKDLNVMTWWISGNKIPPDLSTAEINNIHYITIATGDSANVGEHRISIDSVYFSGEYIRKNDFLLILLITNLTSIISFLFLERRRIYFAQGKYLESIFLLEEERNNLNFKLIRDPLTHAFNRYAIESLLIKYSERGPLEMPRLSIIYLDIDHFKVINDTFGHHVGDSILIEVVNLIQDSIGCDDVLVRWGGGIYSI